MGTRSHSNQRDKKPSSTTSHSQLPVRSRPFAVPAQPEASQPEIPDLQTQLENAQRFGHSCSKFAASTSSTIQPKLSIGAPDDKYEQEADRVAAQVVQQLHMSPAEQPSSPQALQREALPEDDERQMQPTVQRSSGEEMAIPDLESAIAQSRRGGHPLADNVRQPMEQAFGADFSGVRVHTDPQSDQLNRSIQARAFTTKQDIFFRQGIYDPVSQGGQKLLAHELTHVVQQSGGRVARMPQPPDPYQQPSATKIPLATRSGRVLQRKFTSDFKITVDQLKNQLENNGIKLRWNEVSELHKKLEEDKQEYKTIEDVLKVLPNLPNSPLNEKIPATTKEIVKAPSRSTVPPPHKTEKEIVKAPPPKTSVSTSKKTIETDFISMPSSGATVKNEEVDVASSYVITKQLGDGSHHQAYELEGTSDWVLLENKGGDIEETVKNRKKAYAKFPDSIIAKMGPIVTLQYRGKAIRGVLLEKMSGEMYHSTRQGWAMGMKKTVDKWKQEGLVVCKQKIEQVMKGINVFIDAGQVVDDFQYWVTKDGLFKLSDVKSAQEGDTKKRHADLVDCLKNLGRVYEEIKRQLSSN